MIVDSIILRDICVKNNFVEYKFEATGEAAKYFKNNILFCEYNKDISDVPKSILSIPFIGSFIALSWLENFSFWVDEIDRTYYDAIRNLKIAYQEMYQECPLRGRLIASKIIDNQIERSSNKILLFGGGVDAHTSFVRHINEISHIINIQGWFKSLQSEDRAADADFSHCINVTKQNNKEFLYVRSNFAQVVNAQLINKEFGSLLHDQWWHGLQHSMAFISITIPIAYKFGISDLIIASSYTVGDNKSCASFVTTDSEFKFAKNGNVLHDAFELSRQDKTHVLVEYQKKINKDYPIKVCSFNDKNCCECEKCFRTVLAIVAEGGDPEKFDFHMSESLKNHWSNVVEKRLALWGIEKEFKYWISTSTETMRLNYENLPNHEFIDWFLNYDFVKNKKRLLRKYYKDNFFSILRRKLFHK